MRKVQKAVGTVFAVLAAAILLTSQILYFAFAAIGARLTVARPRRLVA